MDDSLRKKAGKIIVVLIILTLAFIWYNSSLSRVESADISRGFLADIAAFLKELGIVIDSTEDHFLRKLAHFFEFGLLGAELIMLPIIYGKCSAQAVLNCLFFGMTAAVIDETIQIFSDRGSLVSDIWIDFSGVAAAVIVILIIYSIVYKRKSDG